MFKSGKKLAKQILFSQNLNGVIKEDTDPDPIVQERIRESGPGKNGTGSATLINSP